MELDIKTINKYKGKTVAQLLHIAQKHFNAFIRARDKGLPCISCGSPNTTDASHYYSRGNYPGLRFSEINVHASCKKCNLFLSGNLLEYRKGLIKKIGIEAVDELEFTSSLHRVKKWDRYTLITVIETYKQKIKEL